MKKRLLLSLVLSLVVVAGRSNMFSSQDDPAQVEERQRAAQQAAQEKARQALAVKDEKARTDWLNRQQQQSESNLNLAVTAAAKVKALESEIRFAAIQTNADHLLALSQQVHKQIQSNGAQSISVTFFKDLDDIERTVKALRKSAK